MYSMSSFQGRCSSVHTVKWFASTDGPKAKGRNVEGENSRRYVLPDNTPVLRLDVNVLLRGALLLECTGTPVRSSLGIQPAVVVASFSTANATLRAQLGVADGDHAQIPRKKRHFWFHILRAITSQHPACSDCPSGRDTCIRRVGWR